MPRGTSAAPGALTIELAAVMRAELARQDMTKTALAEASQISLSQVSKFLRGKKIFDIEELDQMLFVLGLPLRATISAADLATHERLLKS